MPYYYDFPNFNFLSQNISDLKGGGDIKEKHCIERHLHLHIKLITVFKR